MIRPILCSAATLAFALGPLARVPVAQAPQGAVAAAPAAAPTRATAGGVPIAPEYVIGADDVLSIMFWRDKDLSAPDVIVRPDGKITLPLLNDVQAAGRTPEELSFAIRDAARKFVEDPNPTVIVKEIKSRRVFITGRIEKPGPYPLNGKTTILQLIAMAGGLREFVDGKNISLMRSDQGKQSVYAFNYQDVVKKRYLHQNIELKPGDVVVVP
jgi:polysaccharide biosynthesis/export protein